ncbi:unnamed protein product [Boreogadus saida]
MDEEIEDGGFTSKTTLSGEHGRQSKAKSPEKQQRADSPGPSSVSMKSDRSMDHPVKFKDGNLSIEKRVQQQRADSPGPSCVSMKSDHSMRLPVTFKDGNQCIEKRRQPTELAMSDAQATNQVAQVVDEDMYCKPDKQATEITLPLKNSCSCPFKRFHKRTRLSTHIAFTTPSTLC